MTGAKPEQKIFLRRLAVYLLLWWVLAGGDSAVWSIGAAAVGLALLAACLLPPPSHWRMTLSGAAGFIPYFCLQSLRGGIDVARRAFSPRRPLDPGLLTYSLSLPPGPARIFLLNVISLLPGTLSAELLDQELVVHVLDRKLDPKLERLEQHVAALFGLPGGREP